MISSSEHDEPEAPSALYCWRATPHGAPRREILADEASVRGCLSALAAEARGPDPPTVLFSPYPDPPRDWREWRGYFFVGSPLLIGTSFRIEPYGTILHQGNQLELSRLVPVAPEPPEIVGRCRTLAALTSLVANRQTGIHALMAPAGLGKTTFLERFRYDSMLSQEQIFSSSFSLGVTRSLQTWTDLARLPRTDPQPPVEGLLDRLAGRIAERLGRSQFSLVVLDDCHWMTSTDLSILRRLLHRLADRLLLVLASRPVSEDSPLHALQPVVHELQTFNHEDLADLTRMYWPELSDPDFAATKLLQVAGGHPLLTTEIIRSPCFPQALPDLRQSASTLTRALELTRVCETNPALSNANDRAALGLLSHLRHPFPPILAEDLLRRCELSGSLQAGLEAGLLVSTPDRRLTFRHDLLRAASREWCPPHLTSSRDAIIAALLSEHGEHAEAAHHFEQAQDREAASQAHLAAASSAFDHGELGSTAQHTLAAFDSPSPLSSVTFHHYWRGGVALYVLGRHSQAADLLNTGLSANKLLSRKSSALVSFKGWLAAMLPFRLPHLDRHSVAMGSKAIQGLRIAAEAYWHRQDVSACVTAIARAVTIARRMPVDSYVERALSFASAGMLFSPLLPAARTRRLFLDAFRNAAHAPPVIQSEVAMIAGIYHMGQRDWRKAKPLLANARKRSLAHGNPVMACRSSCVEGMALYFRAELPECLKLCEEMISRARAADNIHLEGLLRTVRALALGDLDEPHQALRAFLTMDPIIRTLHPFEYFGVSGSLAYLIGYNPRDSLERICEGLDRGARIGHLSYASPVVFTWLADSLSVATHRGDLPPETLDSLLRCTKRHARLFPSSRPVAAAIAEMVRSLRSGTPFTLAALQDPLDQARALDLRYLSNWIVAHLSSDPESPPEIPPGVAARCRAVRTAIFS